MGMAWYKLYTYIYLPIGIIGYILRLSNISFHLYFFYLIPLSYPSVIPRHLFVLFIVITLILKFILIFGLHFKMMWAWKLNLLSLALSAILISTHDFKDIQAYLCIVLINIALWFIPNYSYFKRRKFLFSQY